MTRNINQAIPMKNLLDIQKNNLGQFGVSCQLKCFDPISLVRFRQSFQSPFLDPKHWVVQNFFGWFVHWLESNQIFTRQIQKNLLSDMMKSWILDDLIHVCCSFSMWNEWLIKMLIFEYHVSFWIVCLLSCIYRLGRNLHLDWMSTWNNTYMQISIVDDEFLRKQFHFGPKLLLKYPFRFENAHIQSALKSAKKWNLMEISKAKINVLGNFFRRKFFLKNLDF